MIAHRLDDPDQEPLYPPIGICPQDCPGVSVTQQPSPITADTLADTGAVEVTGALLLALGMLWAGLALQGRRA